MSAASTARGSPPRPPARPGREEPGPGTHVAGGDEGSGFVQFRAGAEAAGFTVLPNVVLRSPRLTPVAKTVYALLRSYAWQSDHAFPGRLLLAREVPCSPNTLTRGLRELEQHRLITIQRRGLTLPNIYWLEPLDSVTLESLKVKICASGNSMAAP